MAAPDDRPASTAKPGRTRFVVVGAVLAVVAGLWGFVVAVFAALPCIGEYGDADTRFERWLCTDESAAFVIPMIVVPIALVAFAAHRSRTVARWRPLLIGFAAAASGSFFTPSVIEWIY